MKNTNELINRIKDWKKEELSFLQGKEFRSPEIQYYLADLIRRHEMSNAQYIQKMNLERSYGYQLLNGRRKPSRELLIRTAILLRLDLEQTQRLLKIGGREVLYPRVKKDAIAVYAIEKGLEMWEYQELLDAYEK